MSSQRVRVAVIGCGQIGPTHVSAVALDQRTELSLVCDTDLSRAAAIAPQTRATADWQAVVGDPQVDLVVVATPHHLHADMACAALAAGKHVWIEKPLATTPADIDRILAAAKASGRVAAGVFQHRHTPLVRRLHELVAGGDFGAVERVDLRFRCTRTPAYYASGPWRGRWDGEGGALLINQGIHHIDLAQWFAGEPLTVSGTVSRRHHDCMETEDAAELTVACRGGTTLTIDVANDHSADWAGQLAVQCAGGRLVLDVMDRLVSIEHPSRSLRAEIEALALVDADGFQLPGKADYGHSHARQASDVISAILAGRRPQVAVEDAATANRLVLAAYHAAATGAPAPLAHTGPFRRPVLSRTH